jgi:transcriptional regulator with XRE-family HTH domain
MQSIVCIDIVCRAMVCKQGSSFFMEKIEKLFGEAVRDIRSKRGLSQEDFADEAGIHRTYVSSIELGKVQVSIGIAQKLARALKVPLSQIFKEIEKSASKS